MNHQKGPVAWPETLKAELDRWYAITLLALIMLLGSITVLQWQLWQQIRAAHLDQNALTHTEQPTTCESVMTHNSLLYTTLYELLDAIPDPIIVSECILSSAGTVSLTGDTPSPADAQSLLAIIRSLGYTNILQFTVNPEQNVVHITLQATHAKNSSPSRT